MKIGIHHLYIVTTSIAMLMFFGLDRTPMPWWFSSLHCAIWIVLGLILSAGKSKKRIITGKSEKSIIFLFATPYIFFWLFTIIAWIANKYIEPNTVSRAISLTLQYLLMIFYVITLTRLFGVKLIKYTFDAAVLNNIIVILFAILRWGIKDFITVGLIPFSEYASSWTLDNLNISAYLEVHDITFAFGFFLIYYFLFYEGKNKKKNIIICCIFIYLGLKRIQLAALFLVIGLSVLITGKTKRGSKFWASVVTIGSLLVTNLFVWLIDTNIISTLASSYGINFMGRLRVYFNLSKYFDYGPQYLGHGMAYGRIEATNLVSQNILNFTGHSDVLMNYIDYGFWEFQLWIFFICFICSKHIIKNYGSKETRIWMLSIVYSLITYLTDNTVMYFCFQTVFMIIVHHMFLENKKNRQVLLK